MIEIVVEFWPDFFVFESAYSKSDFLSGLICANAAALDSGLDASAVWG